MSAMTAEEKEQRRSRIIAEFGPWTNYNIDLGDGVFTMHEGREGMAEQRVSRIVRVVQDIAAKPISELRVLDLACYEGAFGVALAQQGASVVGLEARREHVVKAQFATEALALDQVEIIQADVRELDRATHGAFDVVLCLGILYHLDAPDCFEMMERIFDVCTDLAIVETQVGLSRSRREVYGNREYRGRTYPENTAQPGASKDNSQSFWPSRASLLNLLSDVGFTSVSEVLTPVIPDLAAFEDHVTLVAWKGLEQPDWSLRWPERVPRMAHPSQGPRYRARERVARLRGGGMAKVFPSPDDSR